MQIQYQKVQVNDQTIFYREGGNPEKPVLLLLHGFPTASYMFRNLIPLLTDKFHLIAPDLIGFGQSSTPNSKKFEYSFDHLTYYISSFLERLSIDRYYMYVFDYGAPVGFRLALHNPQHILGIVSQNGNIYEEGLGEKWSRRKDYWKHPTTDTREKLKVAFSATTIKKQYLTGEDPYLIAPDGYSLDIYYTKQADYAERQLDLIFDYQTNVQLYPKFQQYLRTYRPKLLAIWGKNDPSFIYPGAQAFKRDDPNAHIVLLDAGHFALESHYQEIAQEIKAYF